MAGNHPTPERRRLLVWGAGAIGGTVGAHLARRGHDVTLVDIDADHVARMRNPTRGLAITGPIAEFSLPVAAATPESLVGTWDCVLLAVKAHHTENACRAVLPHLSRAGYVVSLQNGLCETMIAAVVGRERTIGCFVNFAGDFLEPGLIRYGQRGTLAVGELDGRMTARLAALESLLRDFEPNAFATDDIWAFLWGKLGFAALLYGTALGISPMAPLLERADLLPVWRALCGEVMAVAHAEGVRPRPFDGFDPDAFLPGAPRAAAASIAAMVAIMRSGAKTHSGYWRDIAVRRRRTEIDAQIVPVLAIADRHGIACPTLHRLVELVHALESGKRRQDDDNPLLLVRRPSAPRTRVDAGGEEVSR
jgi:2-dehydropantoate 2-reductase